MHFPLSVLFEDNYLLALNKPCGIVTDKDIRMNDTLEAQALAYLRSKEKYPEKCFIGLPHRLDRPVSGVVLFAKKKSMLKKLSEIFEKRKIEKTYWAIVESKPKKSEDALTHWLVKDAAEKRALVYDSQVKNSTRVALQYKTLTENTRGTLLEIKLLTGKFHQIRAQLAHIGCPIAGDARYGAKSPYREHAICLHARELRLLHPATGHALQIQAPAPEDAAWKSFIDRHH